MQDLVLHINAPEDYAEESRAAALSFWEQLQSYALRYPAFRQSKRPLERIAADAPDIVQEMVAAATSAGVGPMFTFRGAVVDQVGRFLAEQLNELTVACDGDYFIRSRKRMKLAVKRRGGAAAHGRDRSGPRRAWACPRPSAAAGAAVVPTGLP